MIGAEATGEYDYDDDFRHLSKEGTKGCSAFSGIPTLTAGFSPAIGGGPNSHTSSSPLERSVRQLTDEMCNRSVTEFLERTPESHPVSLRDTSLKGGGIASSPYEGWDEGESPNSQFIVFARSETTKPARHRSGGQSRI